MGRGRAGACFAIPEQKAKVGVGFCTPNSNVDVVFLTSLGQAALDVLAVADVRWAHSGRPCVWRFFAGAAWGLARRRVVGRGECYSLLAAARSLYGR